MADIIPSAASAAAARVADGVAIGKTLGVAQPMGQALPQLRVQVAGPGVDIRWNEFNYPPVLRLIHFDISELQLKQRRPVRLMNFAFILTTFTCFVNLLDTTILWAGSDQVPTSWLLQSFLHLMLLPAAALFTFYMGYRGLAAPEPLLAHRFQCVQLAFAVLSVLFALIPFHCINGMLTLATTRLHRAEGMQLYWILAILVESGLWMLNAFVCVINVANIRRMSVMPASTYNSPPMKGQSCGF